MLPTEPNITYDELKVLLDYDPDTGELWWLVSRGPLTAGTIITGDYVKINGRSYVVGRVIWCLYYGEWPPLDRLIDHKNGRHGDNWIDNLRLATPTQNSQNKSGYSMLPKGVSLRNRGSRPWAAKIMVNGITKELGSYHTKEEAVEAYKQAAIKYHGEFANHD